VNFLSQIRLTNKGDGPKVAKRLIDVYFGLFKVLITGPSSNEKFDKHGKENPKEKNSEGHSDSHAEMDSRLLSVLLTGVNRAFPFVSSNEADDIIEVQTPVLFQLAEMFIALILRAMKRDVNLKRVAAFSKRLLQIALQQPPQYACACLFLLSELFKARPPLWNMALQNESLDDELEHFEDVIEETDKEPVTVSDKEPATVSDKPSDDIVPAQNGEVANSDKDSSDGEDDDVDQPASSEEDDDDNDDDDDQPASSEDDDDFDDALEDEDFSLAKSKKNHKKSKKSNSETDNEGQKSQESIKKPLLPGGYDPRHREPSYCNADRVSWWELLVLASHAHPSVATMARTLLSGANIVYNGNPLNDLSLTAFLDKFMEKKPKQSTWHGGSQIEPVKQLDVNNLLIGPEILALAEADVPPEDLVFHKFYTNKKSSSSKPKKKKKKPTDEDDVDDYFGDDIDGEDESDNEEIEDLLDSADPSLGPDGDFDYDDLDKVANEDDDDLIGDDVSDADIDIDIPSDIELDDADDTPFADDGSDDDNDIEIGDVDDATDEEEEEEDQVDKRKRKRKTGGKKGASPFASYEEFEHMLEDDDLTEKKPSKDKNKSKRKKMEDDSTEKKPSKDKNKSKKRKKKSAQ
ncbi:CCAAT-binding factor, partial [Trifolium pratense]